MSQLKKLFALKDTEGVVEKYHTMKKRDREMLCTMLNEAPSSFIESVIAHPMIHDTEWAFFLYAKHPVLTAKFFFQKESSHAKKTTFLGVLRNIGAEEAVQVALTSWVSSSSPPTPRYLLDLASADILKEKFTMADAVLSCCHNPNDPFLLYKTCVSFTEDPAKMKKALVFLASRFTYSPDATQEIFNMLVDHENDEAREFLFRRAPNKSQNVLSLLERKHFHLLNKVMDEVPKHEQTLIIKKILKQVSQKTLQQDYPRIFSFYLKHQMLEELPNKPSPSLKKM